MKPQVWHIITCEYPPQPGGVSDYTKLVAKELAAAGDEVHVWCPPAVNATALESCAPAKGGSVYVHRDCGDFKRRDLRLLHAALNQFESPRRLLVQWVPHGYGFRSMNLAFCWWLWRRARRSRDRVEVMIHEPFLPFSAASLKRSAVAAVHRLMTIVLLRAASQVWISSLAWASRLRPYAFGRAWSFDWLPVGSNIPLINNPAAVNVVRTRYAGDERKVVGHFGTYEHNTAQMLDSFLPLTLQHTGRIVLLMGRGSEQMREQLLQTHPEFADRIHATGVLDPADLSVHLQACDLMLQPYIDGVTGRRTSVMVALSHGIPVVTTQGKLTEPIWIESGAVALAPVNDAAAVEDLVARIFNDPAEQARLGHRAKELYRERFDLAHTIAALRQTNRNEETSSAHRHSHLEPAPDRRY